MDDQFELFLKYMEERRHSSINTLSSYRRDLGRFFDYLGRHGINSSESVEEYCVRGYILSLEHVGFSSATICRNISSIRSFYRFLYSTGQIESDPACGLHLPKVKRMTPDIMTVEEVSRLLSQPGSDGFKMKRDKAMLELLYATGIRVSELITLSSENVNLVSGYIICIRRGRSRIIPFGQLARTALTDYLENARPFMLTSPEQQPLFVNCRGGAMTRQGFWKIIKAYAAQAGIEKDITPHSLRHSFAAHLLENGADIRSVQEMMGDSDQYFASNYMNRNKSKIRDVYLQTHPRA